MPERGADRSGREADGPGAVETGAAAYIERLLETDLFRSWQPQGLGFSSLVSLAALA